MSNPSSSSELDILLRSSSVAELLFFEYTLKKLVYILDTSNYVNQNSFLSQPERISWPAIPTEQGVKRFFCEQFNLLGRPDEIMNVFAYNTESILVALRAENYIGPVDLNNFDPLAIKFTLTDRLHEALNRVMTWTDCDSKILSIPEIKERFDQLMINSEFSMGQEKESVAIQEVDIQLTEADNALQLSRGMRRELILNDYFILYAPRFNTMQDTLLDYLWNHSGNTIQLKDISSIVKGAWKRALPSFVNDMGFSGVLKDLFWKVSEQEICLISRHVSKKDWDHNGIKGIQIRLVSKKSQE